MKNKKVVVISCVVVIVILLVAFFVLKDSSTSIIGEWKIDYYITEDGNISQNDIGEYFGENYQTANSAFKVVFESDGKAMIYLPTYEGMENETRKCDYEIKGNDIYLSTNGDTIKGFEMKDNMLVVYNIANFNGNAVLRKD